MKQHISYITMNSVKQPANHWIYCFQYRQSRYLILILKKIGSLSVTHSDAWAFELIAELLEKPAKQLVQEKMILSIRIRKYNV